MSKFRISTPLLRNRTAVLHWFGNVRQDSRHRWTIRALFVEDREYFTVDCAIGLLPGLRLGQTFKNGEPSNIKKNVEGSVTIPQATSFKDEMAIDVCRKFNYYLNGINEMMMQRMVSFLADGMTYYIPFVELVRSLFASSTFLSNGLFRPNYLGLSIENYTISSRSLDIQFSGMVPASIITEDFVYQVAWILSHKEVLDSYQSIYTHVERHYQTESGSPLFGKIPPLDNLEFTYRGIQNDQMILILELLGVHELDQQFENIFIRHPQFKERVYTPGPKKARIKPTIKEFEVQEQTPWEDTNQPIISSIETNIGYTKKAKVIKVLEGEQVVHTGREVILKEGRGGIILPSGVDESVIGGNVQPIELKGQTLDQKWDSPSGLREFQLMFQQLQTVNTTLKMSLEFRYFPIDGSFAHLPNGNRRQCAILIAKGGEKVVIVLEADLSDGHSLTTLVLYLKNMSQEKQINSILRKMVINHGYWDENTLNGFRYKKLKHTHTSIEHWAIKINSAIMS